jgi:hypothetical protein
LDIDSQSGIKGARWSHRAEDRDAPIRHDSRWQLITRSDANQRSLLILGGTPNRRNAHERIPLYKSDIGCEDSERTLDQTGSSFLQP